MTQNEPLCNLNIFQQAQYNILIAALLYATLRYSMLLYTTFCYSMLLYATLRFIRPWCVYAGLGVFALAVARFSIEELVH
jgi:hypothetical protein